LENNHVSALNLQIRLISGLILSDVATGLPAFNH
jgi:hypothetical protein